MKRVPLLKPCVFAVAMATAFAPLAAHADEADFGLKIEQLLKAQSEKLFGVEKPLENSAAPTVGPYRTSIQTAKDQVLIAHGLKVEFLTREAANATDRWRSIRRKIRRISLPVSKVDASS